MAFLLLSVPVLAAASETDRTDEDPSADRAAEITDGPDESWTWFGMGFERRRQQRAGSSASFGKGSRPEGGFRRGPRSEGGAAVPTRSMGTTGSPNRQRRGR